LFLSERINKFGIRNGQIALTLRTRMRPPHHSTRKQPGTLLSWTGWPLAVPQFRFRCSSKASGRYSRVCSNDQSRALPRVAGNCWVHWANDAIAG